MNQVSIDIDGVLTKPLFYSPFFQKIKKLNRKYFFKHSYNKIEATIMRIFHYSEETIPGAISAIKNLHENSYSIVLNSSRPNFLQNQTLNWVRKSDLKECIKEVKLRKVGKTPIQSKLSYIKSRNIRIHLDDDPFTVEQMARSKAIDYVFFINPTLKDSIKFQQMPHVICKRNLQEAVNQIIEFHEDNQHFSKAA